MADKLWDISGIEELIKKWDFSAPEGNNLLRCYFMKNGHIASVEFLSATDERERIAEARRIFETAGKKHGAEGFEVWDGPRFVYRYPEQPLQP